MLWLVVFELVVSYLIFSGLPPALHLYAARKKIGGFTSSSRSSSALLYWVSLGQVYAVVVDGSMDWRRISLNGIESSFRFAISHLYLPTCHRALRHFSSMIIVVLVG